MAWLCLNTATVGRYRLKPLFSEEKIKHITDYHDAGGNNACKNSNKTGFKHFAKNDVIGKQE